MCHFGGLDHPLAHVVGAGVTEHVAKGVHLGDASTRTADDHGEFGLEMHVLRFTRIDDGCARADHGRFGLHEEKREFGRLGARFLDVQNVVEPDTEDPRRMYGCQQRHVRERFARARSPGRIEGPAFQGVEDVVLQNSVAPVAGDLVAGELHGSASSSGSGGVAATRSTSAASIGPS